MILNNLLSSGRYTQHEMGYSENYSPHHYEPPFQTVPGSIQNGGHWPSDMNHQQGYGNLTRDGHVSLNNNLQNMMSMHSPVSIPGQDSKPVIQAAVLAGYSGEWYFGSP